LNLNEFNRKQIVYCFVLFFFFKTNLFYFHVNIIQARYGGGFLSLFEFNRWLFLFNLLICILVILLIILPLFTYDVNKTENILEFKNLNISNEICSKVINKTNDSNETFIDYDYEEYGDQDRRNFINKIDIEILFSKCCTLKYKEHLNNLKTKEKGALIQFN
jgi:hypothetical protein